MDGHRGMIRGLSGSGRNGIMMLGCKRDDGRGGRGVQEVNLNVS